MTQQTVDRQRLSDAARARLVWAPGDRNQSYYSTPVQSEPARGAFSPSASQVSGQPL